MVENYYSAIFGDTGSGNYTEILSDGSIYFRGDATVWNDLRVAANNLRVVEGGRAPTWSIFKNNGVIPASDKALSITLNVQEGVIADYAALDVDTNGHFSFDCWIYPTDNFGTIFEREEQIRIRKSDSRLIVNIRGTNVRSSTGVLINNAWQHIAVVCEKETVSTMRVTLYVDSVVVSDQVINETFVALANDAYVANRFSGVDDFLFSVNEMALYNVPLSASQISERYNGGNGTYNFPTNVTASTDVIGCFRFNEDSGSVAANLSGTLGESYDMIWSNSPTWVSGNIDLDGNVPSRGVALLEFESGTLQEVTFAAQLGHDRKADTALKPHIHWVYDTDKTGTCVWGLEYTWQELGGEFSYTNMICTNNTLFTGSATGLVHVLSSFPDIPDPGAGAGVSSMIICRLFRDPENTDDTYDGGAYFLEFDFHYEIDSVGSRQLYVK